MKLLETYKEVLKEFGITESDQVSPVGKMTYVQEQLGQQKAILNRLLFDVTTAKINLSNAKDELSIDAHKAQVSKFTNDIRQTRDSIRINTQLIEELREEHPELRIEE